MDNEDNDSDNSIEDINTNIQDYSDFIEKKYTPFLLEKTNIIENDISHVSNMLNSSILYDSLHNYSNYVKTVYYILLKCKINNSDFRDECPCCSKNISYNVDLNSDFIPSTMKMNHLIKKFMSVINLLPCYCNFKIIENKQTFYKGDYFNFKDTYKLYLEIIPKLIELLNDYYNITFTNAELKLCPLSRCIHEDIRYYNLKKCIHKPHINTDITHYILHLNKLNIVILKNIETNLFLFSEQSIQYFHSIINNPNVFMYFKKLYVKQFNVINLNHIHNGKTIFNVLINSPIQILTLKNIFEILFKEYEKITNINKSIIQFVLECIKYQKYELAIELFTFYTYNNEDNENLKYIISHIFNQSIIAEMKFIFLKNIYDKKINFVNLLDYVLINESIIEFLDNTIHFEKIYDNIQYEKILDECIKQKKIIFLEYFLKKYYKKILNAYINYFSNIPSDNIEMLKIISKYSYDINVKINPNTFENGNICLFYYCIKKNFIQSAILLIESNIFLNNLYNGASLLVLCIQTNNYELGFHLMNKNEELGKIFYENISPLNILLSKMSDSPFYLQFLNKLIHYDTNYTDEYNLHVGFGLLKSHLKKHEKIMLFQSIKYKINPTITLKNPLIIEAIIRDEYEIAYILNCNMSDIVYSPLIHHILKKMNLSDINIFTFELREYNYMISLILLCVCVNKITVNNFKKNKKKIIIENDDSNLTDHFTEISNNVFIKYDDDLNDEISLSNISFQSWGV